MKTNALHNQALYHHLLRDESRTNELTLKEHVVVVGTGYVGVPLCLYAAAADYQVIGFDISAEKIVALQNRVCSDLALVEQRLLGMSTARFTDDPQYIKGADIYLICVPTPVTENMEPDLGPLLAAAKTVATVMEPGSLIIVESTVNPSVSETQVIPKIEEYSGLKVGTDFHFAYCPERVNPGDATYNTYNIARVLAGYDQPSLFRALYFYEDVLNAPIAVMENIKEAEAVKMVENAFRDVNIAFVNELAMAFDLEGIDIKHVIEGAASKPFAFMAHYPGCGVGGHCIPVDPYYLIEYGKQHGFDHQVLRSARSVNESMPHYMVKKLVQAVADADLKLDECTVALLGISYKRDVGDKRESPALVMLDDLKARQIHIETYDPYVPKESTVADLSAALTAANVVLIATNHSEFCELLPEDFVRFGVQVVVDGRNCLDKTLFTPDCGVRYVGIGR